MYFSFNSLNIPQTDNRTGPNGMNRTETVGNRAGNYSYSKYTTKTVDVSGRAFRDV